jgi:coproporphyrinogen III oxidase-like Fe-S oxidoreductase
MELAARTLQSRGLARYEVASYALPGQRCAHNEAYWTGVPYLGVGTSAASMLTPGGYGMLRETLPLLEVRAEDETLSHDETDVARVRLTMADPPRDFARAVDSGGRVRVEVETLTTREAVAEDMMLSMRMTEGMPPELVGRGRSCGMGAALDRAIERATGDGLAERAADGSIVPTRRGWLLGNELYGLFWGLAHD